MRFDRWLGRLSEWLAATSAIVLLAMVLVVCGDVLLRNLGSRGLPWSNEAGEYGLYFATIAVAPWLLRRGQHVRIDIVVATLPARLGWALEAVADAIGVVVCLLLAGYGAVNVEESLRQGSMVIKTLVFPEWWLLAPLPVVFGLLAMEFGLRMRRLLAGERVPRQEAGSLA